MDATSELRQACRTAALITGALITGLAMHAVIAQLLWNQASFEGMAKLSEAQMRLARYTAWLVSAGVVAGFVLVLLGGPRLDFYLLGSLSLALLLANFPRYEAWEEWIATPAPRL